MRESIYLGRKELLDEAQLMLVQHTVAHEFVFEVGG
jgi:hypothetical protein